MYDTVIFVYYFTKLNRMGDVNFLWFFAFFMLSLACDVIKYFGFYQLLEREMVNMANNNAQYKTYMDTKTSLLYGNRNNGKFLLSHISGICTIIKISFVFHILLLYHLYHYGCRQQHIYRKPNKVIHHLLHQCQISFVSNT